MGEGGGATGEEETGEEETGEEETGEEETGEEETGEVEKGEGFWGRREYRLDGSRRLRFLLRRTGSKDSIICSVGPGIESEDIGSTSSESSSIPV